MRTLSFEPDDGNYEIIYSVLVTGSPVPDRVQARVHDDLCARLRRIGQLKPAVDERGNDRPYKRDELRFYVTVAGGDVVLEEEGYRMAVDRCTAAFPGIHVSRAGDLDRALTWLESVPKQEPKPTVRAAPVDGEESQMAGH